MLSSYTKVAASDNLSCSYFPNQCHAEMLASTGPNEVVLGQIHQMLQAARSPRGANDMKPKRRLKRLYIHYSNAICFTGALPFGFLWLSCR